MKAWGNKLIIIFGCCLLVGCFYAVAAQAQTKGRVQYTYDNLNRVIRADYRDGSYTTYTYDKAGNMTSSKTIKPKATPIPTETPGAGDSSETTTTGGEPGTQGKIINLPQIANRLLAKKVSKPGQPKNLKITVSKKKIVLRWKKDRTVKGTYVYASKKKAKGYKRLKLVKGTKNKVTLKKAKYRYYKIQSYKTKGKKKIFSKYSKAVKVKKLS